MNFLDEIIQGIAKECEKEKNKDQNYYGDELPSSIKKIWSDVEDILEKNNDITIKENKKEELGNNKMNINRVKAVIDNRKDLNKGDIVRIIKGEYKALSDKKYEFLDYVKTMDKVLIQTDEFNRLYVNPEDIELIRKAKEEYVKNIYNEIEKREEKVVINIKNDILTVMLNDETTWDVQFDKEDNLQEREKICYYAAKEQQYKDMVNELIKNK